MAACQCHPDVEQRKLERDLDGRAINLPFVGCDVWSSQDPGLYLRHKLWFRSRARGDSLPITLIILPCMYCKIAWVAILLDPYIDIRFAFIYEI